MIEVQANILVAIIAYLSSLIFIALSIYTVKNNFNGGLCITIPTGAILILIGTVQQFGWLVIK